MKDTGTLIIVVSDVGDFVIACGCPMLGLSAETKKNVTPDGLVTAVRDTMIPFAGNQLNPARKFPDTKII